MPLVHATGRTSLNKNFNIAFAFINSEKTANYALIIENLAELYKDNVSGKPTVIVIDKEAALKNLLRNNSFFSTIRQIICQWYILKNVLSHATGEFAKKKPGTK